MTNLEEFIILFENYAQELLSILEGWDSLTLESRQEHIKQIRLITKMRDGYLTQDISSDLRTRIMNANKILHSVRKKAREIFGFEIT